jgi:hypothetical protein
MAESCVPHSATRRAGAPQITRSKSDYGKRLISFGQTLDLLPGEKVSDEDFKQQLETLNEELETLNARARELEATIVRNVAEFREA